MLLVIWRVKACFSIFSMVAIVVCWPVKASAEWTEWLADAEISYTFQDNINHAMFDSAEQSDQAWSTNLLLGRVYQMDNKDSSVCECSNTRYSSSRF